MFITHPETNLRENWIKILINISIEGCEISMFTLVIIRKDAHIASVIFIF